MSRTTTSPSRDPEPQRPGHAAAPAAPPPRSATGRRRATSPAVATGASSPPATGPASPPAAPVRSGRRAPGGQLEIPRKESFAISEAARLWADLKGCTIDSARVRLYRAIQRGEVQARRHLGTLRLPYREVVRIIKGEEVRDHE